MPREKAKFPHTPEEVLVVWRENRGYVGLCDLGDFIKLYIWDGMALSWQEQYVFPKVDHKELMIKISHDPKGF